MHSLLNNFAHSIWPLAPPALKEPFPQVLARFTGPRIDNALLSSIPLLPLLHANSVPVSLGHTLLVLTFRSS